MERQLTESHNQIRRSHHLSPLRYNTRLQRAAQSHCHRMAQLDVLSHEENIPGRTNVGERARRARYSFSNVAENIASGQTSVAQVMQGWMNSSGHRANILNGVYQEIGVAIVQTNSGTLYWCIVFGRRMGG